MRGERCGAVRGDFRQICPSCGHRPDGEGRVSFYGIIDMLVIVSMLAPIVGLAT